MKRPIVIIAGPTAVGKTSTSVAFAKDAGGEVVSCDSMQVYRRMDIGSAKVTRAEMQGVPHHLIDILEPTEPFDVTVFQEKAKEAIEGIYARGHLPVLAGGTGFYIQSVLYDIDFTENGEDRAYRASLQDFADEFGAAALKERLRAVDPAAAEAIPTNNVKRVIRALEYFEQTGERISDHNARERQKESPFDYRYYVLTMDRGKLYERIGARVDRMMEEGFLDEVRRLKEEGCTAGMTSMQGLGYKQLLSYLNGSGTLSEAVEKIKAETRHFAKRQLTWFRRERGVVYIDVEKENVQDILRSGTFG
ncbi:MAG: tRNA (adenosine(37)-N6)-dimethylallyltransferase MiaA [Lachnospiraceae bacterium]|nr:tRNA (adenosine(37)-N6)-dimethylallyltransferase MiaA [Lachnospiraceae bacterium]MBP5254882.1 tRNA (adenosine(37)-N6)-dimethylallyltransferase MiaA [Lachnospiraceae bacterium]